MQPIQPCLTFRDRCEEAVNFYCSLIPNSRVVALEHFPEGTSAPVAPGSVMHCVFELNGREYTAFDGGEHFQFTDGFSLVATCDNQEEIDLLWERLGGEGGQHGPCGWVRDRFGVSWQVVPAELGEMLSNAAGGNSEAAMQAMLQMTKLDIAELRRAYTG